MSHHESTGIATRAVLETEPRHCQSHTLLYTRKPASSYLFHNNPPKRVRDEYQWTINLLLEHYFLLHSVSRRILYLWLLSLVHQAAEQTFGMIRHLCRRLSKRRVGVVAERHNASIGDLLGQEVFQPERLRFRMCPGLDPVTAQSVHGHDAKARMWSVKWTEQQCSSRGQ